MCKKILIIVVLLILLVSVSVAAEKTESFTWDPREELIVITAGNGVEGFNEFIIELDKVLPGVSGMGSGSFLDFTTDKRDLRKMENNHTVFMIRPKNIKELEKLEAKYPELVPLSCSKLKSYSFPLLYFSRDDKGKIRGVIITNKVTPLLVKLLTKGELPLNIPFRYENGQLLILEQKK